MKNDKALAEWLNRLTGIERCVAGALAGAFTGTLLAMAIALSNRAAIDYWLIAVATLAGVFRAFWTERHPSHP